MSEITCLKLSIILWLVHIVIQASFGNVELPFGYLFTSRDTPAQPKGVMFGRASRALGNYTENLVPFAAVDLALIATNHTGGIGPTLWILARIAYIPLYLFAIAYARSAAWGTGVAAVLMMLAQL